MSVIQADFERFAELESFFIKNGYLFETSVSLFMLKKWDRKEKTETYRAFFRYIQLLNARNYNNRYKDTQELKFNKPMWMPAKKELTPNVKYIEVHAPAVAHKSKPGQFVIVREKRQENVFL